MNNRKVMSYSSLLRRAYNEFKLVGASGTEKELAKVLELYGKERQIKLIEFLMSGGLRSRELAPAAVKRAVGY